jgi:hypothetical protein
VAVAVDSIEDSDYVTGEWPDIGYCVDSTCGAKRQKGFVSPGDKAVHIDREKVSVAGYDVYVNGQRYSPVQTKKLTVMLDGEAIAEADVQSLSVNPEAAGLGNPFADLTPQELAVIEEARIIAKYPWIDATSGHFYLLIAKLAKKLEALGTQS